VLTFHDRCQTRVCPQPQLTLFEQVAARGLEWRAYEGGMVGNCALESSGLYMVRHNPAAYFTRIRSDCARWDVPIGTPASGELATAVADDTLPAFAFITPDACDDMHTCPVAAGEKWLQTWLPRLAATSSYRNGHVAVFVTWDEGAPAGHIPCAGADDPTCRVATFVLSPYTRPGARTARVLSHFSLLQAAERLLGLKLLGGAAAANGMLAPFGLR
jgi:hypothetical protein